MARLLYWTLTAQEWTGTFQQVNSSGRPVAFHANSTLRTTIKSSAEGAEIFAPTSTITDRVQGKWTTVISEEQSRLFPIGTVYMETAVITDIGSVWSLIYSAEFRVREGNVLNPSLATLENLFHDFTARLFGFDIDNDDPVIAAAAREAAGQSIRNSWASQGAPPWKITDNRVFLKVVFEDSPYTKQREYSYRRRTDLTANQVMDMTNCIRVSWTFYGPESYSNALRVFALLGDPRLTRELELNEVFLVPDVRSPTRTPELFAGNFWERADVYALFNVHVRMINDMAYLQEVSIYTASEPFGLSSSPIHVTK